MSLLETWIATNPVSRRNTPNDLIVINRMSSQY